MKNKVAEILKGYAIVNALAGVILGIIYAVGVNKFFSSGGTAIAIFVLFASATAVASFGIYAFGELIQLLQDIKNNTLIPTTGAVPEITDDEIPTI